MIGQRIKALRKEKKLTQTQLAEGIITKSMLSMIENGKAEASMRSLRDIAKRLDVSVQSLLNDPKEAELQAIIEEIESKEMTLEAWKDEDIQKVLSPYLKENMNSVWQGKAYELIGDSWHKHGDRRKVLTYYNRAIEMFEKLNEKEELIIARISKAYYLLMWNCFDEAIEQIEAIEQMNSRNMKTKVRVEFSMLMVFKKMMYEDDLEGAIRQLEAALDYMDKTKIYYRVDDVYRVIAICALYLKDEPAVIENIKKAKQYTDFTGDVLMKVRIALTEAVYAIDYRYIDQLGEQIELMDELLNEEFGFVAAFEMCKGVHHAFRGDIKKGREAFLDMLKHYDKWITHSFVDQAIYFEGMLIGTTYGCGDEWIPMIEQEVSKFPEGKYRSHLTSLIRKAKG